MNYEGYNPADFREPTDQEYRDALKHYNETHDEYGNEINYVRAGEPSIGVAVTVATPPTWNEAINAMSANATVEKKADFAVENDLCMVHVFSCGWCNEKYRYPNNERFNGSRYDCYQCWIDKLNSPYDGAQEGAGE